MRNSQGTRFLLDASFILPTFGISVGDQVLNALKRLSDVGAEIFYSRISIIEVLGVAARRLAGREAYEAFCAGLRSIMESGMYWEVREDAWVYGEAHGPYAHGHRDMIGNILYAGSIRYNLRSLTLDKEHRDFVRRNGLRDTLFLPDELAGGSDRKGIAPAGDSFKRF